MLLRFQEGRCCATATVTGWVDDEETAAGDEASATLVVRLAGSKMASRAPASTVARTSGKENESFITDMVYIRPDAAARRGVSVLRQRKNGKFLCCV